MKNLSALLSPNTIAIIGASPDPHILRGSTLRVMQRHAYAGRIYPISRSHAEVQGIKAFASIADVPEQIDLAVFIIPAEFVPDELERCAKAGVKAALILTSGFSEEQGASGNDLQLRLQEIAARYDLIVCGPNTEGFANTDKLLCPTFSPAVDELAVPLVPVWRKSGHVAVIAQSGGMGFAFFDRGRPKEIPFSFIVTTGNEACLETFDVIDYLLEDERTDVFLLFMENIKGAATFRRVAQRAFQAGKPIIVAKVGASEAGQRAALSHTAALAGSQAVYGAMFQRYGIIEGGDLEAMVDYAAAFSFFKDRLPQGTRVGIGTASGGGGGWLADACLAAGLQVPELDKETRTRIDAHLPSYGTSQNPVDGTAQAIRTIGYIELARLIASSDQVDAVIMVVSARSAEIFERERENLFRVARETRKPILMWSYTLPCAASVRILSEAGYPLFTNMQTCARALYAMASYRALRDAELSAINRPHNVDAARHAKTRDKLRDMLCEYEAANVLREYGITFPKSRLVASAEEAVLASVEFSAAVALKVQSPDLPHKTEARAIALNLRHADAIRSAYDSILANARDYRPNAKIRGVLVQAMAPQGIEMILGVQRDAVFGPILMVGFGGIHVEVHRDVAFAPVPLSHTHACALLNRLRGRALLDGVRGADAADIDALLETMMRLSEFSAEYADAIEDIDLNPVIVHRQGQGVSLVDALILCR